MRAGRDVAKFLKQKWNAMWPMLVVSTYRDGTGGTQKKFVTSNERWATNIVGPPEAGRTELRYAVRM